MNVANITIVVCTYNRSSMLRDALRSLYDLRTAGEFSYEILVVDNNSPDDTPAVIEECRRESRATLRGVRETKPGVAAARNRGVREAHGEWIAFFDDDQIADADWLYELRRGVLEKDCRIVGGAVHLLLPEHCERNLDPFCRMLLGESKLADEPIPYNHKLNPGAGNLMVEKSIFDEVGLFNEALRRGEDTDLYRRTRAAGLVAWYLPAAIIHHMTPNERLEDSYVLKLSRNMGELLAIHEWNTRSTIVAAATWVAKAGRAAGIYWPQKLLASVLGRSEAELGARCKLSLSTGHFLQGWSRLTQSLAAFRQPRKAALASRPLA
ncbi:glycosyltransferase [Anatilimnocola floriformis]|uniref:glycosyltransferase n=1 Tax=Anatilimnocola floriformis TaxID=2948575 RepID=UPI0020C48F7B|nr:glycosyltransferase [Anatilimnocola floriformis]